MNVSKNATKEWQLKWTPAITEYSENLPKGKHEAIYKQNQQMFQEGMLVPCFQKIKFVIESIK